MSSKYFPTIDCKNGLKTNRNVQNYFTFSDHKICSESKNHRNDEKLIFKIYLCVFAFYYIYVFNSAYNCLNCNSGVAQISDHHKKTQLFQCKIVINKLRMRHN